MIVQNPQYKIQTIPPQSQYIFTIDPSVSTDFDDAFSVTVNPANGNTVVHVYIANVFFWMETLDLWKSFSKRVSTIYLPDRKRPMLPAVLSEALCSLLQDEPRFAFEMAVEIDGVTGELLPTTVTFRNVLIQVNKNYIYEDAMLLDNEHYQTLFAVTQKMDKYILNSHDVVSHWMVQMNQLCGEKMATANIGVFRAMSYLQSDILQRVPAGLSEDIRRTISTWNNTTGQYCLLGSQNEDGTPIEIHHELMKVKSYIHITSPIRRLVDLLNQMLFMMHFKMIHGLNDASSEFLKTWLGQLEYINISMRAIRKVQTDCEVLRKCMKSPEILQSEHRGIVFDKVMKNDGTYSYMVYLEHIRMLSRINTLANLDNHGFYNFKMFVFEDEEHIHKKIRLHLLGIGA
jgi:exoribonuclease R